MKSRHLKWYDLWDSIQCVTAFQGNLIMLYIQYNSNANHDIFNIWH